VADPEARVPLFLVDIIPILTTIYAPSGWDPLVEPRSGELRLGPNHGRRSTHHTRIRSVPHLRDQCHQHRIQNEHDKTTVTFSRGQRIQDIANCLFPG